MAVLASCHDPSLPAARAALLRHGLVGRLHDLASWRIFMEHHVFAVWDFMSLLKRLQRDLTCVELPWQPVADGASARFINEIVLAEESDEDGSGGHCSHFFLYLKAMVDLGADVGPVRTFVERLRAGAAPVSAMVQAGAPRPAVTFVAHTLHTALHGSTAEVVAVFLWGREELIPELFTGLLSALDREARPAARLRHYLQRHIDLDEHEHGPLAKRLQENLCAGTPEIVEKSEQAAAAALRARGALWSGILEHLTQTAPEVRLGHDRPSQSDAEVEAAL